MFNGRMPKTDFLPYEWYDTPNIHFCSIRDFEEYCRKKFVTVEKRIYLSTDRGGRVLKGVRPNLFAESAVYLLSHGLPPGGERNGKGTG
jgi:methionine biosynthesis protein MetW